MARNGADDNVLIEAEGLTKYFDLEVGVVDRLRGQGPTPVRAVDEVSFTINEGDVMGIAGESGCGKTTLGKLLVKLHDPTEGSIIFDGKDITELTAQEERQFRKRVQMIFQDPFESLNPGMTVHQSVVEPLKINDMGKGYHERRQRVIEVLNDVGLAPAETYLDAFPRELSGGERQRVAIARALVVNPDFIVADEPVSMLDVSLRAGVLNLLGELKEEYGLTYLFISHDLSLIRYMCDRMAVMYLGNVIEQGPTADVVDHPKHPYTEALFDAVPKVEAYRETHRANVAGEVPSPRNPPTGCRFHPRCSEIIPPDEWRGSQDAFRRAYYFKIRVQRGDIGPDDLELEESVTDERAAEELLRMGMTLDVPQQFQASRTGDRLDLDAIDLPGTVRTTLEDAARDVINEDYEAALEVLDTERLQTVCESKRPAFREADGRDVACHLYEAEDTAEHQVAEMD